jgi:hypothetical protein
MSFLDNNNSAFAWPPDYTPLSKIFGAAFTRAPYAWRHERAVRTGSEPDPSGSNP